MCRLCLAKERQMLQSEQTSSTLDEVENPLTLVPELIVA